MQRERIKGREGEMDKKLEGIVISGGRTKRCLLLGREIYFKIVLLAVVMCIYMKISSFDMSSVPNPLEMITNIALHSKHLKE